jgi:hypothetical protein
LVCLNLHILCLFYIDSSAAPSTTAFTSPPTLPTTTTANKRATIVTEYTSTDAAPVPRKTPSKKSVPASARNYDDEATRISDDEESTDSTSNEPKISGNSDSMTYSTSGFSFR